MNLTVLSSRGGDPAADLAFEEALLDRTGAVYYHRAWEAPVLVLGRAQRPEEVDLAACAAEGVTVLRRTSGGTGVLHQGDLDVALVLPAAHPWCRTVRALYAPLLDAVQAALLARGVGTERGEAAPAGRGRSPICFEDHALESLLLGGRKVFGAAQRRRGRACLVHGTLLFALDAPLQARIWRVPEARVRAAMAPVPLPPGARDEVAEEVGARLAEALAQGHSPA